MHRKSDLEEKIRVLINLKSSIVNALINIPGSNPSDIKEIGNAFDKLISKINNYYDKADEEWESKLKRYIQFRKKNS